MSPKRHQQEEPLPLNEVDAEWQAEAASLFSFDVQQQAIPALVIVQPSSSGIPNAKKHMGQIYNTVTGEFYDQIELVFVGNNTPRAVLPFPFVRQAPQLCSSMDGERPYDKYIGTEITAKNNYGEETIVVPETCEECPLNDNPLCTKMFQYFGITPSDGLPFTMRLKKTGMEAAKKLNFWLNTLSQRGQFKSFIMTTEERSSQAGDFYVPVFTVGSDASEMLQSAISLNRALAERVNSAKRRQLSTGDFQDE